METEVLLPFWPTCHQALQWSQDNMIAVAGGGTVGILVPRLHTPLTKPIKWDTVILKVDSFSQADIPLMMPLGRKDWSVGEELAMRNVAALRWSSPGLGMFSRSVLATLYSDHSLVLWECTGRPEVNDNWRRCVIINQALRRSSSPRSNNQACQDRTTAHQILINQRIRAFAWYPHPFRPPDRFEQHSNHEQVTSTYQLLAVSTDAGEILIVCVHSPYDILVGSRRDWHAEVVHRISYSVPAQRSGLTSPFQQTDRDIAIDMSWGGLMPDNTSKIAFIVQEELYHVSISVRTTTSASPTIVSGTVQMTLPGLSGLRGLIHNSQDPNTIICITGDELLAVQGHGTSHNPHAAQLTALKKQSIESHWSEISGIALSHHSENSTNIHLSTHQTCHRFGNAQSTLSSDDIEPASTPSWQKSICKSVESFNTLHRLGGKVQVRTHGLAVMPEGTLFATCISMLPGDSLAHIIHSEQLCSVLICESTEPSARQSIVGNTTSGPATSSILLNFQCELHDDRNDVQILPDEEELAVSIQTTIFSNKITISEQAILDDRLHTMEDLRRHLYRSPDMIDARSKLIARRLCNDSIKPQVPSEVYKELNTIVSQIASVQNGGGILSQAVSACHRRFQQAHGSINDGRPVQQDGWHESCGICHQHMAFEAVKWARCESGHRFVRCALTLIAILQPGISKSCMVCGTQYLNELKMDEMCSLLVQDSQRSAKEPASRDDADNEHHELAASSKNYLEPPMSLARLLLTACDKCIWCGGGFTITS